MKKIHILISAFALALVMIFTSTSPVLASTNEYTIKQFCNEHGLTLNGVESDGVNKFDANTKMGYIISKQNGYYVIAMFDYVGQKFYRYGSYEHVYFVNDTGEKVNYRKYVYDSSLNAWSCDKSGGHASNSATQTGIEFWTGHNTVYCSTVDIYTSDDFSTIFFQKMPSLEPIVAEKVANLEMAVVMKTILGLIPLVIGLMVSWMAFRKGWRALVQLLHRA